ncbi:MAG: Ig-like domain-containing protein [bacterium]
MRALLKRGAFALMTVVLACSSGELTSPLRNGGVSSSSSNIPATVVIAPPATPDLTINTTVNLIVAVRDVSGQSLTSVAVVWTSSDTTVATVSATGLVSGRSIGFSTITAAAGGISASITINVKPIPVNAVSVTVTPAFFVGDSVAAAALPVDAFGTVLSGRPVSWTTRNSAVAAVSSTGVVIGITPGTTKIDAVVGGVTGTATVVVSVAPSAVGSVAVAVGSALIAAGQSTQAAATIKDAVGAVLSNRSVLWTSSNPTVATVSPLGVVTAISLGSVVISASSGGVSGSAPLTVGSNSALPVATIAVSAMIPTLSPSQSIAAAAVPRDANGNVLVGPSFSWSTTDPTIATVSPSGVITGVAPGTVLISATSGGKTGGLSMQVGAITTQPPATVTVLANLSNPDTLSPGDVVQAGATLRNAGGTVVTTVAPTTWSSSNSGVATVNSLGIITALSLGTATVTAANSGTTGAVTVAVVPPPVKTVTMSVGTNTLVTGHTTQAVAVLRDTSGNVLTGRVLTWSHVTPAVATVNANGLITAIGPGSGAIVASSEGRTATIFITVSMPPIASITLSNATPSLMLGQTTQLGVTILDVNGGVVPNALMAWSSNAPTRATVSQTGVVTAVGTGTPASVIISATTGTVTGTITVNTVGHAPENLAALPQVYLNTAAPPAPDVGGVIISVNAGGNLQNALNSAQPGDVIALANGASFTGNFILPNKNTTSTKWITIRPQNLTGMPAQGARMTPTVAATVNLPKILSNTNLGAIATAPGAHHFRIIGVEVTFAPGVTVNTGLVRFGDDGGNGQTTIASIPHDLVLDRSYVHGAPTAQARRGLALNSASSAVIDSYLSDFHEVNGTDAQAIMGWNGPGPFKITNNYLEGSAENILWGGSDPGVPNLVPSDIEIRGNHFYKPPAWKGVWLVKNLYESKNSQRVLIEGNLFENNWQDGQVGTAIALKTSNVGACPWCVTQDYTFRYNLVRNIGGAIVVSGSPDNAFPDIHARRLTFTDNVFQNINASAQFDGAGYGVLVNGDPSDVTIANNTIMSPTNSALFFSGGAIAPRLTMRDNVVHGGSLGIKGSGTVAGSPTLAAFSPTGYFIGNVMVIASGAGYPTANFFPTTTTTVGFSNLGTNDFRLTSSSTYKGRSSEGRDPGADLDMINSLIVNVIVP